MNGTVATEAKDTPRRAKSQNELAEMIRDRGCRTSSGPAATAPRKKAGHMTEADQPVQNVKTACQPGPSTYGTHRSAGAGGPLHRRHEQDIGKGTGDSYGKQSALNRTPHAAARRRE